MPIPSGCILIGGAFSSGFNNGYSDGSLICGPYDHIDVADIYHLGTQSRDTFSLSQLPGDVYHIGAQATDIYRPTELQADTLGLTQ